MTHASESSIMTSAGRPGMVHPVSTTPVIATRGLIKRFGQTAAVDGLDMDVPAGVLAGFLGPNGAGKTTTLRMLLGLVRPSGGEGQVLGVPLGSRSGSPARIGAMIERPAFYPALSGERNLAVLATLGGVDHKRVPVVLNRVGLGARGRDRYDAYSLGMKQRLGIAGALLREPALLVLDEPSNGLDPAGMADMRGLLRGLADDGLTVLVSSHLLAEVEQVCDWLVVIDRGKRVYQGPTAELLAGGPERLLLECEPVSDLPRLAALAARFGLRAERSGTQVIAELPRTAGSGDGPPAVVGELTRAAAAEGITLVGVRVSRSRLEERYLSLLAEEGVPA